MFAQMLYECRRGFRVINIEYEGKDISNWYVLKLFNFAKYKRKEIILCDIGKKRLIVYFINYIG